MSIGTAGRDWPGSRLTVAVLTNLRGSGPEEPAKGVAGFFK